MLNYFRNKANSIATRIIFGSIVVVFALFFGYNQLSDRGITSRSTLALVNDRAVGAGEFEFTLENNEARYRQMLGGNIPDNFRQSMRATTLEQLITQKVMADAAAYTGLFVSNEALADTIRRIFTPKEGTFDPIDYTARRKNLLAAYHFDIEAYLREQLAAEQIDALIGDSVLPSDDAARDAYQREHTQWTFELVTLNPKKLLDAKKIAAEPDVAAVADALQTVFDKPAARDKVLKTYGIEVEKIGPVGFGARDSVLGADAPIDALKTLFTRTPAAPNCPAPLTVGAQRIVCRLLTRDVPAGDGWEKARETFTATHAAHAARARSQQWMLDASRTASIQRLLTADTSAE